MEHADLSAGRPADFTGEARTFMPLLGCMWFRIDRFETYQ
jgi:hypothetical protein